MARCGVGAPTWPNDSLGYDQVGRSGQRATLKGERDELP